MMFPHAIMRLYYTELWVNCQRRHEAKESRQAAVYGPVFVPADFLPDYYAGCYLPNHYLAGVPEAWLEMPSAVDDPE